MLGAILRKVPETPSGLPLFGFISARSRRGIEAFRVVQEVFAERGEPENVWLFRDPGKLLTALDERLKRGQARILVGGGDGILGPAAARVARASAEFAVIPAGTGNSFAREIGISLDFFEAAELAFTGHAHPIDLSFVDKVPFLNVCTLGLTTAVVESLDPTLKKRLGRGAYMWAVAKALATTRPFEIEVVTEDGDRERFKTLQFVAANGRFQGGMVPIHEDAEIDDGYLHAYALNSDRRSDLIRLLAGVRAGDAAKVEVGESWKFRRMRVESRPVMRPIVDGELLSRRTLDLRCDASSLKIVRPDSSP